MNLNSHEQNQILDSWACAAAKHAERIRAEKPDIADHVDNQATFTEIMTATSPFRKTTEDIAEVITGYFGDSLN